MFSSDRECSERVARAAHQLRGGRCRRTSRLHRLRFRPRVRRLFRVVRCPRWCAHLQYTSTRREQKYQKLRQLLPKRKLISNLVTSGTSGALAFSPTTVLIGRYFRSFRPLAYSLASCGASFGTIVCVLYYALRLPLTL